MSTKRTAGRPRAKPVATRATVYLGDDRLRAQINAELANRADGSFSELVTIALEAWFEQRGKMFALVDGAEVSVISRNGTDIYRVAIDRLGFCTLHLDGGNGNVTLIHVE